MKDIEISHIKQGEAAKGLIVSKVVKSTGFYDFKKGSQMTTVPNMAYCPDCSSTHELKWGGVIPKWILERKDLEFRLAYQTDENGIVYGYCTVCNRDLRDELFDEDLIKPKTPEPTTKEQYVKGVYYKEGYYWVEFDDYKKARLAFSDGIQIKLCFIDPNGDIKAMNNQAFSNARYLKSEGTKLGIIASMWE